MTVSVLSTDYAFAFDQLMNISVEINILLPRLADDKTVKKEEEDLKMDDEIKTQFNLPEVETNNEDEITDDSMNVEPENADEKLNQFEPYVEPELETPEQIDYYEKIKQEEKYEIERILDSVESEGEIGKTIEDIFNGEENNVDCKIEDIFIDDNEAFENDDITEEDKQFIRSLIDKTNFFLEKVKKDDDIDFTAEEVNIDPPSDNEDDVIYVITMPVPSGEKP